MSFKSHAARIALAALSLQLAACGSGLSGEYVPQEASMFMQSVKFEDGHAYITSIAGQTSRVDYEVDGERVMLKLGATSQMFTLDKNGCLEGGQMIGTFCKKS